MSRLELQRIAWMVLVLLVMGAVRAIATEKLSDSQIRQRIVADSLASYPGNCPCPYNTDRAGRRCGGWLISRTRRPQWGRRGIQAFGTTSGSSNATGSVMQPAATLPSRVPGLTRTCFASFNAASSSRLLLDVSLTSTLTILPLSP